MTFNVRVDLTVPYSRKEEARALGARWDGDKRTWYAPPGTDIRHFDRRWLPEDVWTLPDSEISPRTCDRIPSPRAASPESVEGTLP
jgi:hypothetical protein